MAENRKTHKETRRGWLATIERLTDGCPRVFDNLYHRRYLPGLPFSWDPLMAIKLLCPWIRVEQIRGGHVRLHRNNRLFDICWFEQERAELDGFSIHVFVQALRDEIQRRRNSYQAGFAQRDWISHTEHLIVRVEVLDWAEGELVKLPLDCELAEDPSSRRAALRHLRDEIHRRREGYHLAPNKKSWISTIANRTEHDDLINSIANQLEAVLAYQPPSPVKHIDAVDGKVPAPEE